MSTETEYEKLLDVLEELLVSKILNGERQLAIEHIKRLSKKFGVSPSVFIDSK